MYTLNVKVMVLENFKGKILNEKEKIPGPYG